MIAGLAGAYLFRRSAAPRATKSGRMIVAKSGCGASARLRLSAAGAKGAENGAIDGGQYSIVGDGVKQRVGLGQGYRVWIFLWSSYRYIRF